MNCPRCKNRALVEHRLRASADLNAVEAEVQQCPKCFGQLFERRAFSSISEVSLPHEPNLARIPEPGAQLVPLRCPACDDERTMMKVQSRRESAVTMDVCGDCSAIWLDVGELDAIRGHEAGFAKAAFDWVKKKLD